MNQSKFFSLFFVSRLSFVACLFLVSCNLFFIQGCASLPESDIDEPYPAASSVEINHNQLARILPGMTLSEVATLMDQEIIIGYSSDDPAKPLSPVKVQNPYKVELVTAGGHDYVIYYYVSSIQKSDGMIADDELLPVIFEDEFVIGKGWKNVLMIKANAADGL